MEPLMLKIIYAVAALLVVLVLVWLGMRWREKSVIRAMTAALDKAEADLAPSVFNGRPDYDRTAAALLAQTRYLKYQLKVLIATKKPLAAHRKLVGREFQVLVQGPSAENELLWEARLPTQAPEIDGVCYIGDPGDSPLRPGQFRRMRITAAHDYDLVGDLTDDAPEEPASPLAAANPFLVLNAAPRHSRSHP